MPHPWSNISREEAKALEELREDNSSTILIAGIGVTMNIMDKQDYSSKVQDLLAEKDTYRLITKDLTTNYKNKLMQIVRTIKAHDRLNNVTYKSLYPTSTVPQNFTDSPKSTNINPLKPITSSMGAVTYWVKWGLPTPSGHW